MNPLISIIIPTYNRANTISRAIDSVLKQTYNNFEMIIVEDGSQDDTVNILNKYKDARIKVVFHEHNKGVTAAKNTGLNNITGEWFTVLDSDDEMLPHALETMINIPLTMNSKITAVTCNCVDTTTQEFSGKGINADGYIDVRKIAVELHGEFWGLTKTELLLDDRLNENLWGYENTLWYKINERATRYYIHQGLRLYHTDGQDRISNITNFSLEKSTRNYLSLPEEQHYLETLKKYRPESLVKECLRGIIYLNADNKKESATYYYNYLKTMELSAKYKMASFIVYNLNPFTLRKCIQFWRMIK